MKKHKQHTGKTIVRGGPRIVPAGANPASFTPINPVLVDQMYAQLAPQQDGTSFYAPGAPIMPMPGLTPAQGPRQFEYQVGYNISNLPRSTERYSFGDLRQLARLFDGIQLCEQVWFDYVSKLELSIEPRPELVGENQDLKPFQKDIAAYHDFFAYPDREHDLKSWLRMGVRDQLEIDALAIYVRRTRSGDVYSLDILDGATIKPLIDDRGRRPLPPYPAYEQFVYGVPSGLITSDDLIYVKETDRTDSVYGLSRVERIILKVNQALRKQNKDLLRFTDGTIPAGVLETPANLTWTPDEVEAYEQQFNALMAGNDQARARIKVLPSGFIYKATDETDIMTQFDSFLLNVTAACFGLTMAELGMTENVNKSSGDSQENVVYRRAMQPLMQRYADLLTMVLRKYFNENRFIVRWKGFEEHEDFQMQASAYSTLVNAGIISPSRAAQLMHLPVDVDLPSPILMTKSGPVLLQDFADPKMRDAQKQAQLAGLKLAATNPASAKKAAPDEADVASDEKDDASPNAKNEAPETAENAKQQDRSVSAEFRRWREVTLKDLKAGRTVREFQSDLIPASILAMGTLALRRCANPEDVRMLFDEMRSVQC